MSEIGWAFIGGKAVGGSKGSVQYSDGTTWITGSDNFKYLEESNTVVVSSSVYISGTLFANDYHVNVINENVTNLSSQGSSVFGNSSDDTHQFTGSLSVNGNFELLTGGAVLSSSADSDLIYELAGNYYSASNGDVPHEATFDRAVSPALVVSGTTVFNDPVSIQGGLYGASPIQVHAPLSFTSANDPTQTFSIEPGKIVGSLIFSSSNQNDSFKLEGNSVFEIESDSVETSSYATIDLSKFSTIAVADHPNMSERRHAEYIISNVESQTKIPIFTGSNASDLTEYQMQQIKVATTETKADIRRNSYKISFGVAHTEFDSNYESLLANNSPDLDESATNSPFESTSFDDPEETIVVAEVGSFGEPGESNAYGVKRGMKIAGNLIPQAIDRTALGKDAVPYPDFETKDLTIGHPAARWGDMYISNDRKLYWGQTRTSYTDFYLDNDPSNTASFGLNSATENLEVGGVALKLEEGLLVNSDGYINFNNLKGSSGYGFRDSSGTIEYKNEGGEWASFSDAIAEAGVIGPAEDTDYSDGLFTDFTSSMAIGTPIDRFNEIFKIIAPPPAPNVEKVNYTNNNGQSVNLSFDASNPISGYENSSTDAGFAAVSRNSLYGADTNNFNFRLGVYNGNQIVEGIINYNITASVTNGNIAYTEDSFGNADNGTLKLELNGTTVHTIDLTSALVGNNSPGNGTDSETNANGSGFISISETESTYDGNGSEWYIFKYRTAKYRVHPNDQVDGLNYVRIIHEFGTTTATTNYIEWINDSVGSSQALSVTNQRIEDVSLVGSKFVSGVEYNTDLTANYKADLNNFYRNVYPNGNVVSFNETNCGNITSQAAEPIGAAEDETKVFEITGSINNNQNLLLNGSISVSVNATHPLKNNISNAGQASITGMLIDNLTTGQNNNLTETFIDEDFRITSGSYDTQNSALNATWDSQVHLTSSGLQGYNDGMVIYNRRLYNPADSDLPNNGNFTSLINVEPGQPNYSSETGIKTFFRKIQNDSGNPIRDMKITSQKNGLSYSALNQALSNSNTHFYIKIPDSTGWMGLSDNFVYGSTSDGDGALIDGATDNSNPTGTGNSVHCVTFGTQSVADDDYVVVKIETDGLAGYISQLNFKLGASDVGTPASPILLRDIDCDDDGDDAILSFGASNTITNYSNATGSTVDNSLNSYDSNDVYENVVDKLGVFSSFTTINGKLNADVNGNSNFDAFSFSDAHTGDLILEVNGDIRNTITLSSTTNAITDTDSSVLSVSELDWSTTTDKIPDFTKSYRTGTYQIHPSHQNLGWNYARVYHTSALGLRETNYIEWIVDTNNDALAITNESITNFGHSDVYYQSGVGYFASRPTGSYSYTVSNVYKNVYSDDSQAISFPTLSRCSVSNIEISGTGINNINNAVSTTPLPSLNNSANCQDQDINVTASVLFDNVTSIAGHFGFLNDYNVSIDSRVKHPLKANIDTNGLSKSSFMHYSGSNGSTNLTNQEHLNTESYRIVSGNYANQADTHNASNSWDSENSINDTVNYPEYSDGLLSVNGYLISPLKIGSYGDTRNVQDGGSLQAPSNNPDYSSLSEDTRTYYRYFRNTTGQAKPTFTLNFFGDAVLVSKSGAFYTGNLGSNKNINVELKVPYDNNFTGLDDTSTAWGDCVKPYSSGVQPTSDGIGVYSGGGSGLDQTINSNSVATPLGIQLQEKQIRNNQYFVIKITAHKDWTGYLSRITVTY